MTSIKHFLLKLVLYSIGSYVAACAFAASLGFDFNSTFVHSNLNPNSDLESAP